MIKLLLIQPLFQGYGRDKEVLREAGHLEEGVWTQWIAQVRRWHSLYW